MQAGHEIDEDTAMDLRDAAAVMRNARERADRELEVRDPVLFASAGLVLLLGYGAIWLSVAISGRIGARRGRRSRCCSCWSWRP